jgi:hypothetical protein
VPRTVPRPILGLAELGVVAGAVGREGVVRLGHRLEALFRVRVVRVLIRMVEERQAAVRLLQLRLGRVAANAEHFVVVRHGCSRG